MLIRNEPRRFVCLLDLPPEHVLVLQANSTRRVATRKAKRALAAANVRVLELVLNNRTFPTPEKIYRLS